MPRKALNYAVAGCAVLALAGCEGPAVTAPEDARPGLCSTSGECGPTDGRDPPADTTTTTVARYTYGSNARVSYGSYHEQAELWTTSNALAGVASTTVEGRFYATELGCGTDTWAFRIRDHKTAPGSPAYLTVSATFRHPWNESHAYRVLGFHSFTPAPGAQGGGSFTSSVERCV
ncbi:MAG TPA: hypothetical protein VHG51_01485 [Longimicrobiaceae bacterium]|nr:hypothetical protein [Longimicrobiaceae bacterium]